MKILFIVGLLFSVGLTGFIVYSNINQPVVQGTSSSISSTIIPTITNSTPTISVNMKEVAIQFCTGRVKEKISELEKMSSKNAIQAMNLIFRFCLTEQGQEPFDLVGNDTGSTSNDYVQNNPMPTIKDYSVERKQKCNQEMIEYNTCLGEKTAAETEYNTCMNEKSSNPYKMCFKSYNASKHCYKPICL